MIEEKLCEADVRVSNLCVAAGDVRVLRGISICVSRGDTVAILGHNGAGKTSFLRAVLGMFRYSFGSVRLFGAEVKGRPVNRLHRVGAAIGTPVFHDSMRVIDHLRMVERLRAPERTCAGSALRETIEKFQFGDVLYRSMGDCSSGTRKRVAIAAAMLGEPELIIIDDPTAELDNQSIGTVESILKHAKASRRSTIMISSHSFSFARGICDTVFLLERGRCLFYGKWSAFEAAVGSFYEIRTEGPDLIRPGELPQSLSVISLDQRDSSRYLVNIQAERMPDLLAHLVQNRVRVAAVVPISLSSEESIGLLEGALERPGAMAGASVSDRGGAVGPRADQRHAGVVAPGDAQETSGVCTGAVVGVPRGDGTFQRMRTWTRRLNACVGWELRELRRSAALWSVPLAVMLLAFVGISGSAVLQKSIFQEEVYEAFLICNVLAGLCVAGALIVAISAGVSITKMYATNRLRFMLVLPVSNASLLVSKAIVWCIVLPAYVVFCAFALSASASAAMSWLRGYPWMPEETMLAPGLLYAELGKTIAEIGIAYSAIGLFAIALGTMLKRTSAVVTTSVLLLIVSFVAIPGFRANLLPMASAITSVAERMMLLGNGVLPMSQSLVSSHLVYSAAVGVVSMVVALIVFSRKVW